MLPSCDILGLHSTSRWIYLRNINVRSDEVPHEIESDTNKIAVHYIVVPEDCSSCTYS